MPAGGGVPARGCTCPGGCTCLGGVPAWGVYLPRGVYLPGGVPAQVLPLVNRITDTCKNITLSQTSFVGGNKPVGSDRRNPLFGTREQYFRPLIGTNPVFK